MFSADDYESFCTIYISQALNGTATTQDPNRCESCYGAESSEIR